MRTREWLVPFRISVSGMGRLRDSRMPGRLLRETPGTARIAGL